MCVDGKRLGAGERDADTAVPAVTRYGTSVSGTRSTANCAMTM
jgi:hypothetical protein